ncbi:MAG: tRNA-dihydrouridine synthase family protein [Desulfobacterales bacterium]|nr:tRNA-dihydrouridine synthase family protein [Desulfobacterales bacterium]
MKKKDEIIILAPLQGFTDLTFRNVYAKHFSGIDEAIAPFISTMGEKRMKASRLKDVELERNRSLFVVPQIMGNVAEDFIFLADHLHAMGHETVNWNLGCPHSKIAKKQRGSGLLLYPEKIDRLLEQIVPAMKPSLSVKIRLGRRNKDEIYKLLEIFDRHPVTEIILHPRTGTQMYTGTSDHDAFEKAMEASRHKFVYNGDITDMASHDRVRERFPHIHRIMIGRGILSNPFLPEQIKGLVSPEDGDNAHRLHRLKAFHDELMAEYAHIFSGPGHLTDRMKGFWTYLGPSFEGHKKPLKQILKSTSLEIFQERVESFFQLGLTFSPETQPTH